jgi:hypothetical protein
MQVAYVPEKPKIHRSYWGTLDRGIEPKEWMTTAIPGAFFALALAYFVWLRRKRSDNPQAQAE